MASFLFGLIGLFLGFWLFSDADNFSVSLAGALLSATLGIVFGQIHRLSRRQDELNLEILKLQNRLFGPAPAAPLIAVPATPTAAAEPLPVLPLVEAEPVPEAPPEAAEPPLPRLPVQPPGPPDFLERRIRAARDWLFGGNTLLRVGVVVLFLGSAFALSYTAERVTIPIELRYAAVALIGIALLVIGWRLRLRRQNYGLMLQGGGVAVLYLTIFAAMHLNPLIGPTAGFALLVLLVAFSTILAVTQDALGLAAAAAAGGFAAPILAASSGEHHVALFSYFLLLDAGILTIAWFKAWRPLNLVGFAGTLGIGSLWARTTYQPEMLASTEPFLILFFLMFVAIASLFARRVLRDAEGAPPVGDRTGLVLWAARHSNYLDGILLFGAPLAAFGLQAALIQPYRYGTAFSALGLGLFYIGLAALLLRRTQARYLALVEVFIALGVVFGTLAVPLGLDARWTAAAWAVEGAGIYWIAVKQDRRLGRAFAVLVQLGAAIAYLDTVGRGSGGPLLAGSRLGAAMLAAALLSSF